ncbi:MAG TPA: DMT family transporter [Beijerinckiaceae bacterium]|jgi:drug/metabolite transporter (DMT)-like permease
MSPRDWALLAALSVLWGGSFLFVGIAVREIPPLTLVAGRVLLAALTLWAVLPMIGLAMPRAGQAWAAFFGMGLLNNAIPFTLIVWGQSHIASGLASILNATTPLFGVVVAHALTADERATPGRVAGVLIGFGGVAAMIGPGALTSLGVDLAAQLAVLAAAFSYALAGIFGRRFRRLGIPPLVTATGQVTASSALILPLALLVDRPWTLAAPSGGALLALVALALLSTALAYALFFRLLASAGATNLLLVTFLIPVSATLLGAFVLGERLAPRHALGMALIGLGLAALDGRPWERLRRALRPAPLTPPGSG